MSRNYKFHNPEGLYFVSFAVINWIDVFTRNEYKDIFLSAVRYTRSDAVIREKVHYIHNNPVEVGLVSYPKDYVYSSAMDYAGEKGLLSGIEVLDQVYGWR